MLKGINFLISGVGGQGTLLMSNILSEVGLRLGFDVKKNEVHGMSQRGGSVTSHVRWGGQVFSPVIGEGEVDILLALEKLEGLRYVQMLRPQAKVLMGSFKIDPLSVSSGADHYPGDEQIFAVMGQLTQDYHTVPTLELATQAGSSKAHNIVLLGALSAHLPDTPPEVWLQVIEDSVPPRHIELNCQAFRYGREFVLLQSLAQ
jgi:indolepyruvate ferredoxin oxidoreductase, beta subunit